MSIRDEIHRLIAKYIFFIDKDGQRYYAPFGIFGRPVIVPDANATALARLMAWVWLIQLLFMVLGVVGIACFTDLLSLSDFGEPRQFGILLAVCAVSWLSSWPLLKRATRGLEKEATRTTFDLWLERQAKKHPHELGFATVLSAAMVVVCILFMFLKSIWLGLLGALFCGFATFMLGYAFMHSCPSSDK